MYHYYLCIAERSQPVKPETHLKTGNSFFQSTEHADNFIDCHTREAQLRNESNKAIEEKEEERRKKELKEKKQQKDEEMRMLVSKLEDLKGPPLEIPEYKDAYKVNSNFFKFAKIEIVLTGN